MKTINSMGRVAFLACHEKRTGSTVISQEERAHSLSQLTLPSVVEILAGGVMILSGVAALGGSADQLVEDLLFTLEMSGGITQEQASRIILKNLPAA